MKPMEIKAAKALVRADIEQMRERLTREIKTPHAIPQRIVNGSLSEVIAFKESAEKIGEDYHLAAPPGKRCALKQLEDIRNRLHKHLQWLDELK